MSIVTRFLSTGLLALASLAGAAAEAATDVEIARIFADYDRSGQPGCTVGVMQGGKLAHAAAFGAADLELGKPLDSHSIFNLASVSKQFTAFALLLQQQGKLSLDDPIVKYLPELEASARHVTLRHLLHHTGGLRDYIAMLAMRGRSGSDGSTIQEALLALARQTGANTAPGTEFDYSNTGYFLLGVVVARVSGQSLAEFSRQQIFAPLGMSETRIVDRYPAAIPALARGYSPSGNSFEIDETGWEQVGDGQVHSSVHDLARWEENFYSAKLGGRAVIDQMTQTGVLNSGERLEYAAGLNVGETRGLPSVRHGGSWVGYRSYLLRFPRQHFSVAVLCNRSDAATGPLAESVAEVFLKAQMKPAAVPPDSPKELDSFATRVEMAAMPPGAYRNERDGSYVFLSSGDTGPRLTAFAEDLKLEPLAGESGVYRIADAENSYVAFAKTPQRQPQVVTVSDGERSDHVLVPAWQPGTLDRYAGAYFGDEANARCVLVEREATLVVETCAEGAALRPGMPGEFVAEDGSFSLRFPVDTARIDGFIYDTPGLRNMRFERVATPLAGTATKIEVDSAATVVINASIVDGTGAKARKGAVRIAGDRIVAVGELQPEAGERIVDAAGLTLAPGFIDTHSHHDDGLFEDREAIAAVSQGITTIVAGQDGSMSYPVKELFERMEQTPPAINVASYVGHGDIRAAVMGEDFRRRATAEEVARMRTLLAAGMEAGALGLATGLEYDPGIYSDTTEVLELAREAARHGGRYISHLRSEDRRFWAAVDEIIRIGREAKIPVQISHMKLAMVDWWGQSRRLLEMLDRARDQGVEITGDIYPYEYWHSTLTVLFPERDFTNRATAEFVLKSISPPDGLLISEYTPEPALEGLTIEQIAKQKGMDAPATLMDLIARSQVEGAEEGVIGTSMRPDDTAALIAWPHSNICSDGALEGRHPRGTGAFTRVLRLYVREQKLLSLEEAIRKMSGLAAAHIGIADRGLIRPGAYADLVLLDPATVADRSTTSHPELLSTGIRKVWVNGVVVFDGGKATGAFPGQGLRRQ
ncbi:MAG: serine hydrolase [Steroidobacteraceae bacterium]